MHLFRLNQLRVKDNPYFPGSEAEPVVFKFADEAHPFADPSPYCSLVIGPNGTGKSYLLRHLIDIFRLAHEKTNSLDITQYPKGKYALEYFVDTTYYTITNRLGFSPTEIANEEDEEQDGQGIRFFADGTEIDASDLPLPTSIMAMSIMLTDRFLVLKDDSQFPNYKYLGLRRDSHSAGTRNYTTRTIEYIFKAASRPSFIRDLELMLEFLGLQRYLYIGYTPRYKHLFFKGGLTEAFFEDFFTDYKKHLPRRNTEPWSFGFYRTLKQQKPGAIPLLVRLCNNIADRISTHEGTREKYFGYNIFEDAETIDVTFELLNYLHRLDLISFPYLNIKKYETDFDVSSSSSGEYHFISTMVALLANITDNSLILIDEPEVSLHPNWQMRYIEFLAQILQNHGSAHAIICTHSHFLVSDLKPRNSSIVTLKLEDQKLKSRSFDANTFGWSAEEVLYEVFGVRSTRNHFLEYDLTQLAFLLNHNSQDFDRINEILQKLHPLMLNEADPLKIMIEKAENYLQRNA